MDFEDKSLDLIFSMDQGLRDDLINSFVKLSAFVNVKSVKMDYVMKLVKTNTDLIQRLAILLPIDNASRMQENLFLIDETLPEYSSDNEGGQIFELSWKSRCVIVDLVMKNLDLILLKNIAVTDQDKKGLIKENNNLIRFLVDMDAKCIGDDDFLSNDDRPVKRSKIDQLEEITDHEARSDKLFSELKQLKVMADSFEAKVKQVMANYETTFDFECQNADFFLSCERKTSSDYFYCSTIRFHLQVKSNNLINGTKYIQFVLCVPSGNSEEDKRIQASFSFILIHPLDDQFNFTRSIRNRKINRIMGMVSKEGFRDFIRHDDAIAYMKDNKLKFGIRLCVEQVLEANFRRDSDLRC